MSEGCYFCGGGAGVIERHHIVPRRFDGSDESVNLVDLCPTCHEKLERLYDKRFYDALGVEQERTESVEITEECAKLNCTATADHELTCPQDGGQMYLCDAHKSCGYDTCDHRSVTPVPQNDFYAPLCDKHRVCEESGCENTDVRIYRSDEYQQPGEVKPFSTLCDYHGETTTPWIGDEWQEVWSDE